LLDGSSNNHTVTSKTSIISSNQSKFGGFSSYFNGCYDGDYHASKISLDMNFNWNTDFTIEFWIRRAGNGCGAVDTILAVGDVVSGGGGLHLYVDHDGVLVWNDGLSPDLQGGFITINQWTYVTAIRSDGVNSLYIDGQLVGTGLQSFPVNSSLLEIGSLAYQGFYFNGYIDDMRILQIALTNITIPNEALTSINNTTLLLNFDSIIGPFYTNICSLLGSCCNEQGNCIQTLEGDCSGVWTLGQSCDPNPCAQPGACCDGEGNCTQTLESACAGVWVSGQSCDPNLCVLGACCDNENNCTQTIQSNCDGTWTEGVSCAVSFTPPTSELTAISGTSLLLNFNSDPIIDSSVNNLSISIPGDEVLVSNAESRFGGASAYFDGNTYLSIPPSSGTDFGSGDYTVECWVNISSQNGFGTIIGQGTPGNILSSDWVIEFPHSANTLSVYVAAADTGFGYIINGTIPIINQGWKHIALTRSGNNTRLFIDGIQDGNTWSTNYTIDSGNPAINSIKIGAGPYDVVNRTINGYIDELRVIKGSGLYTSNFSPPDEPLIAILNTSLLLHFDNSPIIDSSTNNLTIITKNNGPIISNAASKFGGFSYYFDGVDDIATVEDDGSLGFIENEDFTIEGWFRPNNDPGEYITIVGLFGDDGIGWLIQREASMVRFYSSSAGDIILNSSSTFVSGNWYHIAVTRNGSIIRFFIDGVEQASASDTAALVFSVPSAQLRIGANNAAEWFNGYIDDLRIVKGVDIYSPIATGICS